MDKFDELLRLNEIFHNQMDYINKEIETFENNVRGTGIGASVNILNSPYIISYARIGGEWRIVVRGEGINETIPLRDAPAIARAACVNYLDVLLDSLIVKARSIVSSIDATVAKKNKENKDVD